MELQLTIRCFDIAAKKVFELAIRDEAGLYISINSFTDIIYFVSKEYDEESVRSQMNELLDFVIIIDTGHKDALKSLKMLDFKDIEDAFQVQCAIKEGMNYIITQDIKGFEFSPIPALSPDDYLNRIS